jgi:hypothetical protein
MVYAVEVLKKSEMLQPESIADTVMFLLSKNGDYIDGQSITIKKLGCILPLSGAEM